MSFCSDRWKAFSHVFKKGNLWAGKDLARPNEEVKQHLKGQEQVFYEKDHLFFQAGQKPRGGHQNQVSVTKLRIP